MERYQPFFLEQSKQEHERTSANGWVNGLYVSRAIDGAFPKGRRYPDRPLVLFGDQAEDLDDEETKPMTDAERFAAFAMVFNKQKFGINPGEEAAEYHD